jgi:hypothetical protein
MGKVPEESLGLLESPHVKKVRSAQNGDRRVICNLPEIPAQGIRPFVFTLFKKGESIPFLVFRRR